jgi:hypothetical protein
MRSSAPRLLPWVVAGALLCGGLPVRPQARVPAATVSLVEGTAQARRGAGIPHDLRQGSSVRQGDLIETGDDTRLELKLPDASALRLGARARMALAAAQFDRPARRQLAVRLFVGKVWARVTSVAGGEQRFQIETENVVAGVRGTTFRIDAHEDRSVLVRVYSGTVTVGRKAWDKLIGRQMQILISADGTPGVPAPFTEADEAGDDWSAWNRKRDELAK